MSYTIVLSITDNHPSDELSRSILHLVVTTEELSETVQMAARAFENYTSAASHRSCKHRAAFEDFARDHPAEAQTLVEFYDTTYSGLNNLLDRTVTPPFKKARAALAQLRRAPGVLPRIRAWFARHAFFIMFAAVASLLPAVLAPTHPLA